MLKNILLLVVLMCYAATAGFAQTTFALIGGLDAMWTNEMKGGVIVASTYTSGNRDRPYLRVGPNVGLTTAHPLTKSAWLRASLNFSLLYIKIGSDGSRFPYVDYQSHYYSLQIAAEQSLAEKLLIGLGFEVRFLPTEQYGLNSAYYQKGQFVTSESRSPDIEYFYQPGEDMVRQVNSRTVGITATVGYVVSPRGQVTLSHFYPLKESFNHPTQFTELSVTRLAFRYKLNNKNR